MFFTLIEEWVNRDIFSDVGTRQMTIPKGNFTLRTELNLQTGSIF